MGVCGNKAQIHAPAVSSNFGPDKSGLVHYSLASLQAREKQRLQDAKSHELLRALTAPRLELTLSDLYVKRKSLRMSNIIVSSERGNSK